MPSIWRPRFAAWRCADLLEAVANAIAGQGHHWPLVIVEDITSDGMAERVQAAVEGRFGQLDILINNSGGSRSMADLGTEAEWDEAWSSISPPAADWRMPSCLACGSENLAEPLTSPAMTSPPP